MAILQYWTEWPFSCLVTIVRVTILLLVQTGNLSPAEPAVLDLVLYFWSLPTLTLRAMQEYTKYKIQLQMHMQIQNTKYKMKKYSFWSLSNYPHIYNNIIVRNNDTYFTMQHIKISKYRGNNIPDISCLSCLCRPLWEVPRNWKMKSTNTNTAKKESSKQTGTTTINTSYKKTKARNARIKTENTNTAKEEGSCDTENAANKQGRPPGGLWRHWDNCRPALLFNFNLRVRCVQRCIHSICFSKIARISAGCVYFWASVELQLCWVQNA